jgi:hypothetical protein
MAMPMTDTGETDMLERQPRLRRRAEVASHVIWDYLAAPDARSGDDVPWRAEAVTPEWLTAILCDGVAGARVERITLEGGHEGSTVRRYATLVYNAVGVQAQLPEQLFMKTTPTLLTRLASGIAGRIEARFYTQIRPALDIEAPVLLFSAHDSASGRTIHLFENLVATKGATFGRYTTTISRDQAEQMVDMLAALHSRFYDTERFTTDLRWVGTYEAFLQAGERSGIRAGHDLAMVEARDVIPDDVFARRDEIWPATITNLAVHRNEPRTLLHSDVHLGNWYITGDGRMGLTDWQCICRGHWARDLAYALSTSLAVDDRRAWEEGLVLRYLDRMRERCALARSFGDAMVQYGRQLFSALLMWTPTLCHPPTMPDMQPDEMSRLMISRISTAISDRRVLDQEKDQ